MFYPSKISSLTRMTTDSVKMELEVDPIHLHHFNYQAGQHIVIRIPNLNVAEHRSYSISSAPFENKLQIGIKKQNNGLVSSYLCDRAKEGDIIEIMAPAGNFILTQKNDPLHLVAFASGSGITPVISMIKEVLKSAGSTITLFYGNKDSDTLMFKSELESLKNEYTTRFELIHVFSRQRTGSIDLEGRIDADKIRQWKEYLFSVNKTSAYLICGPGNMVETVQAALLNLNIRQDIILTEYFTPPALQVPLQDFKPVAVAEGFTIKLKYEGKQYELQSKNNKTVILDMGLKNGIDLPYSCKSGVCSTCQAKLISGEVQMDNNYVLSDAELKQGFILTCQSHTITSEVVVDYDVR
ncbi:MAG: 2Fe-2S iron-sulfur cluster-binding protein [Saprospiraceae bacterium]